MATSEFGKEVEEARKQQSNSIPAQRLIEKLKFIGAHESASRKRWFWELLQNASDYNESVDIRLEITSDKVTFQHNGGYFSKSDMLNLIRPDSNKLDDKDHNDNLGRFGSGLVSTHILSAIITAQGVVEDGEGKLHTFQVTLDRSGYQDKEKLVEQIAQANDELDASYKDFSPIAGNKFNTTFGYNLNQPLPSVSKIDASEIDLDYYYGILPYVLCFMPKVKSLRIEDKRQSDGNIFTIKQIQRESQTPAKIKFEITQNQNTTEQTYTLFEYEDVSTAIFIEDNKIHPYPKEISKIFCGLPMIGTENIGLPIIINSTKFEPKTERDGIDLLIKPDHPNRGIIANAAKLYSDLLDFVVSKHLGHTYNIAHFQEKSNFDTGNGSSQQFENYFSKPARDKFKKSPILKNSLDNFISLEEAIFPYLEEDKPDHELYKLSSILKAEYLPQKEDYEAWFEAINFNVFRGKTYKFVDFLSDIAEKKNLATWETTAEQTKKWLHEVISIAIKRQITASLKIFPDQDGLLHKSNELYRENEICPKLKDLYDTLYPDQRIESILVDPEFSDIKVQWAGEKSAKDICIDIDKELEKQYKKDSNNYDVRNVVNDLFDWIKDSKLERKESLSSYFPWFYKEKEGILINYFPDNTRRQALEIAQSNNIDLLYQLLECDPSDLEKLRVQLELRNKNDISEEQRKQYNDLARKKVLDKLKGEYGCDISKAENKFSVVNGVTQNGQEYPLVIKSCTSFNHDIKINPVEWEQLLRQNSMLWLYFSNEKIFPINIKELFEYHDLLTLSINTSNILENDKLNRILDTLKFCNDVHIDLNIISPKQCSSELKDMLFNISNNDSSKSGLDNDTDI